MNAKVLVQQQFGDKAAAYATSTVHAKGASLGRLVALLQPQSDWRVLDVATAAGHTAHTIAPHVAHMVATDLTYAMLPQARQLARQQAIPNESYTTADAEQLPFAPGSFQLVMCRIAPHHFPNVAQFVRECARLLCADGVLAIVDNIAPHKRTRKKREQRAYRAARDYLNAFEKLRDPSHGRCLSLYEWEKTIVEAGLEWVHAETHRKKMAFRPWVQRMNVAPDNVTRLHAMLVQAPDLVLEFLTPEFEADKIDFYLHEAIMIGKKR